MSRRTLGALAMSTCLGMLAGCGNRAPKPVTFNKDIAPIVFANCVGCHRPGGDGPFSLLTYADAAKHAQAMGEETLERHMPPWLPEPGDFPLSGVRRLSPAQIETVQSWVTTGKLEGDARDLPSAPAFSPDWQLGKPDAVLTLPRPYVLKPGRDDVYRNVIFRTSLPDDVYVRAVELRTGGNPIHHALIRIDRTSGARRRDGEGGQPGFDGMSSETLQDPADSFLDGRPAAARWSLPITCHGAFRAPPTSSLNSI